ncbi:probable inactive tRNA-specific adenosine deaminase-like protein 3 [Diachasma alloeum]|uniref:probable inactive tRNA-specific adenosine deaminase-like protein 3 n=1 Tax=Diachasma alloeum TaxID=454923 RepID=UPI0010FBB7A9|nr:probable inactive tRNA-specific adenosine deaminase-like protein 3 [Diachasma alloeum]
MESLPCGEGMTGILEKKPRLLSDEDMQITVKNLVTPRAIVGKEFVDDVVLREAFIGVLRHKKDIAVALKVITSILPGCGHLKRCSGNRLFLALVKSPENPGKASDSSFASADELKTFLIAKNVNLNIFRDDFEIVKVPERSPRTRVQFTKASQAWPVNFHPDSSIEVIINGNFFDSKQLEVIESCMRVCIAAAKRTAIGNEHCNGSAVILDPDDEGISRILAVSTARVNEHPMWHAAMLVVDLVARIRGGGAWNLSSEVIPEEGGADRKRECPSNLPLVYPESLKSMTFPQFSHSVAPESKDKSPEDEKKCPYLCTNYWIFLLKEPCPLCAMALLHSRVSMIFYGDSNNSCGVLGSNALMHTLPGLNHRYKVWSSVLEAECKSAAECLSVIEH